jgi:hypothetical protein
MEYLKTMPETFALEFWRVVDSRIAGQLKPGHMISSDWVVSSKIESFDFVNKTAQDSKGRLFYLGTEVPHGKALPKRASEQLLVTFFRELLDENWGNEYECRLQAELLSLWFSVPPICRVEKIDDFATFERKFTDYKLMTTPMPCPCDAVQFDLT